MLARLKADLRALVKEIEDIENKEAPTWPAANPAPPAPRPRPGDQPRRGHEGALKKAGLIVTSPA
jgi:hypothetical protein